MARALPLLDIYEQVAKGTNAKVILLCANNYPAKLSGNFGIEGLFDFNASVRERCGLSLVEVSDDLWEAAQLLNPEPILENGVHFNRIEDLAEIAGLHFAAMGTGAQFSYAHIKGTGMAFFDFPRKGQEYMLGIYQAWADFAAELGIQLYTGRRPGVLNNQDAFYQRVHLRDIVDFIKDVSVIGLGSVEFGDLDPDTSISQSEAMNLALALEMNRRSQGIMQLVEQMQYAGMEPNTVEQAVRFNQFLSANLPRGYFADMADNGHIGVKGTRLTENPDDYDLFSFAESYRGPIVFVHHNILYDNAKQPGTQGNLEIDEQARKGEIETKDMLYPERIRDINDYLIKALENPNVRFVVASPEPTCNPNTDLCQLADDVAEATRITAARILGTGKFEESDMLPFAFISKGCRARLDNVLDPYL